MIVHTEAFATYRLLTQDHIDFVALVCHAVPALQADINSTSRLTYQPDHFKAGANADADLLRYAIDYQDDLARTTVISIFSYFESYIKGALAEIVNFHGGDTQFKALAFKRSTRFLKSIDDETKKSKRKLQDKREPAKRFKYEKHSDILEKRGFRFPTELFANFGIFQLLPKLKEKNGMRAWEIPHLLKEVLLFPLERADEDMFEEVRLLRNEVGHGRPHSQTVTLKKSLHYASMLHTLAAQIDKHVTEHFLVIEIA